MVAMLFGEKLPKLQDYPKKQNLDNVGSSKCDLPIIKGSCRSIHMDTNLNKPLW
jgi:hypothetical protein